ncbi:MAG: Calx-beta protein [Phycisphaerales bacterium]|nr:Calx-beta protein [Phycisphaerales bacterium]
MRAEWMSRSKTPAKTNNRRMALHPVPLVQPLERRVLCDHALAAAINLGALAGEQAFSGSVGPATNSAVYRSVTLSAPGTLAAYLTNLSAHADLSIIRDTNRNQTIDTGEVITKCARPGTANQWVSTPLPAGTYYVGIAAATGASTRYNLTLFASYAGVTPATARNVGTLAGSVSFTDFVGYSHTDGYYQFTLPGPRTVAASLGGLTANADLQLIRDANHDGIVQSSEVLATSSHGGSTPEALSKSLPGGTYFVRVLRRSGDTNYKLTLSAPPGLKILFDYRYDKSGWFAAHPDAMARLQDAAQSFADLTDNPAAIVPGNGNGWSETFSDPAGSAQTLTLRNPVVAANTVVIYVGASSSLISNELGRAAPGGWNAVGSEQWVNAVEGRGQHGALIPNPTDNGTWGGSITFSSTTNWNLSAALPKPTQNDFLSVARHEICHVLGLGTADSWNTYVSANTFTGPHARAANGGKDPILSPDRGHWADGTFSTVNGVKQLCEMDPFLQTGTRRALTALDYAGLQDVGWTLG